MSAGQYSEQYEIYRRRQISLSTSQKRERGRNQRFESYKALGKDEGYTLKVDQASGSNGELDREKLNELIEKRVLKDRFVLFVD